jgi:hypothetical protein
VQYRTCLGKSCSNNVADKLKKLGIHYETFIYWGGEECGTPLRTKQYNIGDLVALEPTWTTTWTDGDLQGKQRLARADLTCASNTSQVTRLLT